MYGLGLWKTKRLDITSNNVLYPIVKEKNMNAINIIKKRYFSLDQYFLLKRKYNPTPMKVKTTELLCVFTKAINAMIENK